MNAQPTLFETPLPIAPTGDALIATLTDLSITDMRSVVAVQAATIEELQTALTLLPADNIGRRGVLEYAIKKRVGKLGIEQELT